MGNPVVHFEIAGRDGESLERFYGGLFEWRIDRRETGGSPYGLVSTGENDLGGGIRHEPEGTAEVVLYVSVDDLDAHVERAKSLGGNVRIPPMEYKEMRFALVTDPEGNPVGMIERD